MKEFYTFRLDPINRRLWRGDERVTLGPKAFDVLRYLVQHADRLVTHEGTISLESASHLRIDLLS